MNDISGEQTTGSLTAASIDRRKLIAGAGALTAATFVPTRFAIAQAKRTVRVWTTQSSLDQVKTFNRIAADFERANPNTKVALQLVSNDDAWPKLIAAFSAGEPPEVCMNFNGVVAVGLQEKGLLEPLNDIARTIGDFDERMLATFNDKGQQFALGLVLTVISTMWTRTDLFASAGLKTPVYWDEYLAAAQTLTKAGVYGTALPYGKAGFANIAVDMFVRQGGGDIVAPDGSPAFSGAGTIKALEFLREARRFCPPGANNYSFGETLSAFSSGGTAMGMYTGRTVVEVETRNPSIRNAIAASPYAFMREGKPWWMSAYIPIFINKGPGVAVDEAKLFTQFFFEPKNYIEFLHGAPGHGLPVIKSIAASPEYNSHPILQAYKPQIDAMMAIADKAWSNVRPSAAHPIQFKMGDIYGANILAGALQRVIVGGQSPAEAAGWGQDQIAQILKG